MKKVSLSLYWSARLISVIILAQTLFFKFSGAPESIYIFTTVGMEPWGRIGIGILELVAAALLLFNKTAWVGSGLSLGLMLGAIGMHLTKLGISVQGDGGYLFFWRYWSPFAALSYCFETKPKLSQSFDFWQRAFD